MRDVRQLVDALELVMAAVPLLLKGHARHVRHLKEQVPQLRLHRGAEGSEGKGKGKSLWHTGVSRG